MDGVLLLFGVPTDNNIFTSAITSHSAANFGPLHNKGFVAVNIPMHAPIKKIVSSTTAVCVLTEDGLLYSWGRNSDHGAAVPPTPVCIETLAHKRVISLAAGANHFICCTEDGEAYSWGQGSALGHGEGVTSLDQPSRIEIFHGLSIKMVAATRLNSFAVTTDNKLYTWGQQGFLLGNGTSTNAQTHAPQLNTYIRGEITHLAAGVNHVGVVTSSDLYLWGSNNQRQCAPNADENHIVIPRVMPLTSLAGARVDELALGNDFTLAKATDGQVYAWGANASGECGVGNIKSPCPPSLVPSLSCREVQHIFAGAQSCGCKTHDGKFFTWGYNANSQLGHMDTQVWSIPREVQCIKIAAADDEVCFSMLCYAQFTAHTFGVLRAHYVRDHDDILDNLLKDIVANFNNEALCDVTVKCGDKTYFASKFILGSRSEYFRSMFMSGMKEASTNCIEIDEFQPKIVLEMLRFLHSGSANITEANALSIMEIALKYQLHDLLQLTESFVASHLSIDNCINIFHDAAQFHAPAIRDLAMRFIMHHWKVVGRSQQIENLPQELLIELLRQSAMMKEDGVPKKSGK